MYSHQKESNIIEHLTESVVLLHMYVALAVLRCVIDIPVHCKKVRGPCPSYSESGGARAPPAPPAPTPLLVVAIIIVSEYSIRFAQLISRRNPVAILNTLILLSYTKFLNTIIAVFSFALLEYPDGSHRLVWFSDATLDYLKGKHIVLFLLALIILLVGMAYTTLLLSWQWLLHYQHKKILRWVMNQKVCLLLEPYHAPFNPSHRYWFGLLLLLRSALYIASAVNACRDPGIDLIVIETVMISVMALKWQLEVRYGPVYKKWQVNVIETVCYMNISLFVHSKLLCTGSQKRWIAHNLCVRNCHISSGTIGYGASFIH